MGTRKKKQKSAYDASLSKIFFWSGVDVFVSLLIVCAAIGAIMFFYRRSDPEAGNIMLFCLAMVVLCAYGLPLLSLFRVFRQERILGISWKDRTDCNRPAWERDWYLTYNRGGFLLCHRAYIQRILNMRVIEQTTDLGREKVHCVIFEDIRGKKHTVKFSSASAAGEFRQWYAKREFSQNDDEAL